MREISFPDRLQVSQTDAIQQELNGLEADIVTAEKRLKYYPTDAKVKTALHTLYDHQYVLLRKQKDAAQTGDMTANYVGSWIDDIVTSATSKFFRSFFAPVNTPLEQLRQIQWREYSIQQKSQGKSMNSLRNFPVAIKMVMLSPWELVSSIEERKTHN